MTWKNDYTVTVVKTFSFFVHASLYDEQLIIDWDILFLYLNTNDNERKAQLQYLIDYECNIHRFAFMVGDFNIVLHDREKEGGRSRFLDPGQTILWMWGSKVQG